MSNSGLSLGTVLSQQKWAKDTSLTLNSPQQAGIQDSSVDIEPSYGLDKEESGVRLLAKANNILSSKSF
jgi:hypothetical protein